MGTQEKDPLRCGARSLGARGDTWMWRQMGRGGGGRGLLLPGLKFSQAHICEMLRRGKRKCIFSTFSCVSGSVLGTVCKAYIRQPLSAQTLWSMTQVAERVLLGGWIQSCKAFRDQTGRTFTSPTAASASASFCLKAFS